MKKANIIFWISTSIFFLLETVIPALTSNTQLAVEGIRHLGYPDYFRELLTAFKIAGGLALILPMAPRRLKEWAYAGFSFVLISAAVSHGAIDGWTNAQVIFPLVGMVILGLSYFNYHQMQASKINRSENLVAAV